MADIKVSAMTLTTDVASDSADYMPYIQNSDTTNKRITVDNFFKGVQDVWIPAEAFKANTTTGAAYAQKEWTTNTQNMGEFLFADSGIKKISYTMKMPRNWDASTFTYVVDWRTPATANDVRWTVRAIAYGDAADLDSANWGSEVAVTDTANATANRDLETAESGAVTIGNIPSSTKRLILIEVKRDPANASDTLANDAYFLGIEIRLGINKKSGA